MAYNPKHLKVISPGAERMLVMQNGITTASGISRLQVNDDNEVIFTNLSVDILSGTLLTGENALNITATLDDPSPGAAVRLATAIAAGTNTEQYFGLSASMTGSSYTGAGDTRSLYVSNSATGTGTNYAGYLENTSNSTAGTNVGLFTRAAGNANTNIALSAATVTDESNASNIGGFISSSNDTGHRIGLHVQVDSAGTRLNDDNINTALLLDNGDLNDHLLVGRVNEIEVISSTISGLLLRTYDFGLEAVHLGEITDQNNYDIGRGSVYTASTGISRTITGIANGYHGRQVTFFNIGGSALVFAHASASSSVGNRINTPTGSSITLGQNDSITLIYLAGLSPIYGVNNAWFVKSYTGV